MLQAGVFTKSYTFTICETIVLKYNNNFAVNTKMTIYVI